MAQISWESIVNIIEAGAKDAFKHRNEPKHWWANFKPKGKGSDEEVLATVKEVSVEATTGLKLTLDKAGSEVVLEARPSSIKKSKVFVGGVEDSDASLVFDVKTLTRLAFDFKNVTIDGVDYRVDTRFNF